MTNGVREDPGSQMEGINTRYKYHVWPTIIRGVGKGGGGGGGVEGVGRHFLYKVLGLRSVQKKNFKN